jgi:hypothetical protein
MLSKSSRAKARSPTGADPVGEQGIAETREVVSTLRPDRIGHGILAARDEKLMTHSRAGTARLEANASRARKGRRAG